MKNDTGSKEKTAVSPDGHSGHALGSFGKWIALVAFAGVIIVAMIVTVLGLKEASKTFAENENQNAYISVAMDILKEHPQKEDSTNIMLRSWAVDIFNRYAPVKLDTSVRQNLILEAPLLVGKTSQERIVTKSGKSPEEHAFPVRETAVFLKVIDDSSRRNLSYVEVGIDEMDLENFDAETRQVSTDKYGVAKIAVNNKSIYDFTVKRPGYRMERTQITGAHLFRVDTLHIFLARKREIF